MEISSFTVKYFQIIFKWPFSRDFVICKFYALRRRMLRPSILSHKTYSRKVDQKRLDILFYCPLKSLHIGYQIVLRFRVDIHKTYQFLVSFYCATVGKWLQQICILLLLFVSEIWIYRYKVCLRHSLWRRNFQQPIE